MALSCLSSDGAVTKQAVKKIAEFACARSPQVAFYTSGHRAASIPNTGKLDFFRDRTSRYPLDSRSGVFSWAGPSPPQSFESVNVSLKKWDGADHLPLIGKLTEWDWTGSLPDHARLASNQGMFSLFPMDNAVCPYPCITLPTAQSWGGAVAGYLEVSFTVAVPPTLSTRINLGMFYGFPGRAKKLMPDSASYPKGESVTTGIPGRSAFEDSGGLVGVTVEVTGTTFPTVLTSSPHKRLVMPIKYSRNAPYSPGAYDNQYAVMLWAENHDPTIVLTDFSVLFVASAATDTIATGWSVGAPESLTPMASLNTPLPWGVQVQ